MIVYFSGAIAGGRDFLETYKKMVHFLLNGGHSVPTEHIIADDVLGRESQLTAAQIYQRDIDWLEGADAVIAEISHPSLGVGYEICYALMKKKPILVLYREGIFASRMIIGNQDPLLRIFAYKSETEWQKMINSFIQDYRSL